MKGIAMTNQTNTLDENETDTATEIYEAVLHYLWQFRVEFALLTVVGATYGGLDHAVGEILAAVLVGFALIAVLAIHATRRWLTELLVRAHWRRRLERALVKVAHSRAGQTAPVVKRICRNAVGITAVVSLKAGASALELRINEERLAAALRVASTRVERDPNNASRCVLTVIKRDHFGRGTIPCSWRDAGRTSVWDVTPIGEDELGHAVEVTLAASQVLIGGVPGSGKSNLLQLLAAFSALDPSTSLWVFDPKEVELARWKVVAAGTAGADIELANGLLRQVCEEMTRRYEFLAWHGARCVRREDGLGLHVVLLDEVSIYLGDPDKKAVTEFASLLRKLVTLGRAAGISTVIATQRPATDILPSSIRDSIATMRVAFRCATRESSDIVLGTGWAANGFVATDIDSGQPGVCLLLQEGGRPTRLRCYHLDDDDLDAVVERARRLRP
jgi:hypothetical protein